jgi:hypothetical protein
MDYFRLADQPGTTPSWTKARFPLGGFNLALVMRQLLGKGAPRSLQGLSADALAILLRFWIAILVRSEHEYASVAMPLSSLALRIIIFILACGRVNNPLLPRAASWMVRTLLGR